MLPVAASRRRILVVAEGLDPVGSGRQIELVGVGLLAAGWDATLAVTTTGGSVASRLAAAGARVHRVGDRPRWDAAAVVRLAGLVRTVEPEVVLAWGRAQARLAAAAVPLGRATRLVCRLEVPPRGPLTGLALGRARRVIASSDEVAAACGRLRVPASRIVVVPPGASAAAAEGLGRSAVAARLGLDPAKLWTLCVAPLTAETRLDRLLWAIDQLGVVHRGLEHVLVGTGPWRHRILRRARVQHLAERLHLLSHCDCLPDLLAQSRLAWQSGEAACGGVIADAMAAGIPVVAVASAAARQLVVDGATGRIVPAEPAGEFPRRAFGLLDDDRLAAGLAAAARERAREAFPAERLVAGVLAAIED